MYLKKNYYVAYDNLKIAFLGLIKLLYNMILKDNII